MNCPHHIKIYASEPRSYRDLPIRLAEFGTVYRFEQTGELNGMTRVRGFTQDDAHIFCTHEQVKGEFRATIELVQFVFKTLGFKDVQIRLSLRDPDSDKFAGNREVWHRAEDEIRDVLTEMKADFVEAEGRGGVLRAEGRFPGPRRDRPQVAARHRAARLRPARAVQDRVRRLRQPQAPPGDDPPRPVRVDGAVHGHPDRALRRGVPAVARPGPGGVLTISEKFNDYAREVDWPR